MIAKITIFLALIIADSRNFIYCVKPPKITFSYYNKLPIITIYLLSQITYNRHFAKRNSAACDKRNFFCRRFVFKQHRRATSHDFYFIIVLVDIAIFIAEFYIISLTPYLYGNRFCARKIILYTIRLA